MRICHIISGDLWAGAEVVSYRLMEGLKNFPDIELSAIVFNEGKLAEAIRNLPIPVTIVDEKRRNFLQLIGMVRKIIEKTAPDVIHSHRLKENVLSYFSSKFDKRIQMVCTQHGMPEPLGSSFKMVKSSLLSRYQYHLLSKYFKFIVVVSEDIRKTFLEKLGFQVDKIMLLYNGT